MQSVQEKAPKAPESKDQKDRRNKVALNNKFFTFNQKMASKQQKTRSRFLKVKCNDCGNEQVIFGCAASPIKCLVCEKMLAVPTGGKTQVKTEILEVLDKNI